MLDAAAKGLETAGQPEPLGSLLVLLVRTEFQLGDAAGGASVSKRISSPQRRARCVMWGTIRCTFASSSSSEWPPNLPVRGCGGMPWPRWAGSWMRRRTRGEIPPPITRSCECWRGSSLAPPRNSTRRFTTGACPRKTGGR